MLNSKTRNLMAKAYFYVQSHIFTVGELIIFIEESFLNYIYKII